MARRKCLNKNTVRPKGIRVEREDADFVELNDDGNPCEPSVEMALIIKIKAIDGKQRKTFLRWCEANGYDLFACEWSEVVPGRTERVPTHYLAFTRDSGDTWENLFRPLMLHGHVASWVWPTTEYVAQNAKGTGEKRSMSKPKAQESERYPMPDATPMPLPVPGTLPIWDEMGVLRGTDKPSDR